MQTEIKAQTSLSFAISDSAAGSDYGGFYSVYGSVAAVSLHAQHYSVSWHHGADSLCLVSASFHFFIPVLA